jgi:phage repressor protein C with HTH and peptisase S24 domain
MIIADRLSSQMKVRGFSQSELARRVGMSSSMIGKLTRGEVRDTSHIYDIARALCVSAEFLMGDSDVPDLGELSVATIHVAPTMFEPDPDIVEIDHVDLRFGMGGTFLDNPVDVNKRQFSRAWLREFTTATPEHLFWTTGDGDSMEPTIRSGEIILVDRSERVPRMGDGIWAMAYGEIGMVKRLRPKPDGTVEIHSDNQLVRPEIATDGELHVIGRVIAVVRKL